LIIIFPYIVTDYIPLQRQKQICRRLVTDFVATILTRRDGLCRDFHGPRIYATST